MSSITKNYNATPKTRNNLIGEINPMVWKSGVPDRPYGTFVPAPWLPVQFQEVVDKDWCVISSGKIVALTTVEGWVVPAGLKVAWAAGTPGITYTADDYTDGTLDITTGAAYAVNGTTTYTVTNIRDALRLRGLIGASGSAVDYISEPVGAILYDVYAWAGGGIDGLNPAFLKKQNYQKQKGIQYSTFSQMEAPVVPALHSAVSVPGSLTGSTLAFGSGNAFSATNTVAATRYSEVTNTDFIAIALADKPIAKNTDRTPVTGSATDFLVREVELDINLSPTPQEAIGVAVDRLNTAGDYFIDYQAGVVFIYSAGGASIPSNASGETITYYSYAAAPGTVERYFCITGDVKPGDFLKCDTNSNLVLWVQGSDNESKKVARVHSFKKYPRDLLERVQTLWSGTGFGTKQQMTGTASKGYNTQVTYSGASDTVANLVLNVK